MGHHHVMRHLMLISCGNHSRGQGGLESGRFLGFGRSVQGVQGSQDSEYVQWFKSLRPG